MLQACGRHAGGTQLIYFRRLPTAVALGCLGSLQFSATALEPIIVTATRTAQTTEQALASVTVITRQEIEQQQAQTLAELLHGLAGIQLANSGGLGKPTSLFMRGAEAGHVLVLIDGVKVGSATLGMASFHHYPLEQIERIEIVRGPRSSLYGSEAIGGVIQIFTRHGGGKLTPFFSVGAGSNQTYSLSAGIAGGGEQAWFQLSANGLNSEGFNACRGQASPNAGGCMTWEPDQDGYQSLAGSVRAGYRFASGEVDFHALRGQDDTDFDGDFVNQEQAVQQVIGLHALFSPRDFWQLSVAGAQSIDQSENFKNNQFQNDFDTTRETYSLQNDFTLRTEDLFTLGVDYQNDQVDSSTAYHTTSRANHGIFAQYQAALGTHDMALSLRGDDNDQFGTHTTGGLAWGMTMRDALHLSASYTTAFRAPTFNDLYFPGYGNAHLKPETARSLELGVRGQALWGAWSIHAYQMKVQDLIGYNATTYSPDNINQTRLRGVEGILTTRLYDWDMTAQLSWLDPKNQSAHEYHGNLLPRRANYSTRLDLTRSFDQYTVGATCYVVGKRYDDLANRRKLSGYATLNLRAEYAFNHAWRLQGQITNLFDSEYETAAFYPQPGRGLFITLRYQPVK